MTQTFETTMDNGYGEDLKIRGDFRLTKKFVSRDRTEPDEDGGWILDENSVQMFDDLGWRGIADDLYDRACETLVESFDYDDGQDY